MKKKCKFYIKFNNTLNMLIKVLLKMITSVTARMSKVKCKFI
jgi:hypothetical protein